MFGRGVSGLKVNEYLTSKGEEISDAGVIQSNPETVETSRDGDDESPRRVVGFCEFALGVVRGRVENSNHEFWSTFEDAIRRDLTINALYYNLNEKKVEDFTGKGIEDLKIGLCRTPLEAKRTFVDDPLRVLRAVRFAPRQTFTLAEDIGVAVEGRASQRRVENESEQRTSREGSGGDVERTESALGGGVGDENENGRHRDGLRGGVLDGNARFWRESSRSRDREWSPWR